MFTKIFGLRLNLIYGAVIVALYDLVHILFEFKERFERFAKYETDTNYGCASDLFQSHCTAVYGELGIYAIDFIFTCFLIYGASSLKTFPVLCWIVLSSYHLIDFILIVSPFYGEPMRLDSVPLLMLGDIGLSILGFLYVIYFYKKLVEIERGGVERETLSNVDELNITGVDLEAY